MGTIILLLSRNDLFAMASAVEGPACEEKAEYGHDGLD